MTKTKPSLSQDMDQLQQLVEYFESDQFDLDEAIPKLKVAAELSSRIRNQLNQLQKEVETIELETLGSDDQ